MKEDATTIKESLALKKFEKFLQELKKDHDKLEMKYTDAADLILHTLGTHQLLRVEMRDDGKDIVLLDDAVLPFVEKIRDIFSNTYVMNKVMKRVWTCAVVGPELKAKFTTFLQIQDFVKAVIDVEAPRSNKGRYAKVQQLGYKESNNKKKQDQYWPMGYHLKTTLEIVKSEAEKTVMSVLGLAGSSEDGDVFGSLFDSPVGGASAASNSVQKEREEGQEKKQDQEQEDGASRQAASTSVSSGNLQESGSHSDLGSPAPSSFLTASQLQGGTSHAETVAALKQELERAKAENERAKAENERLRKELLGKKVEDAGQDAPSSGLPSHEEKKENGHGTT